MKNKKASIILIVFSSLVFLLSACAGSDPIDASKLEAQSWVLTAYNNTQPIAGIQPTLQFGDGQVSGTTGCNHYGGSFQVKGDAIRFEGLFSTEMACLEPEGVMEQEQVYLELLRAINSFEFVDGMLTLFTETEQSLVFEIQHENPGESMLTLAPPTSTSPPTFAPPAGFKEYQDIAAGISLYIPESWVVSSVTPDQFAIFQSYPVDKYIGGEGFEPGDTKCDLSIRPKGAHVEALVQQWKSNAINTIISENEVTLQSGQSGIRIEMESLGRATLVITEVNERVVVLTCFGDFTQFDEIALTLSASQ